MSLVTHMSVMGVESSQIMSVMKNDGVGDEKRNGKTSLFQYISPFSSHRTTFCYSKFVVNTEHVQKHVVGFCGCQGFTVSSTICNQSRLFGWPLL